MTATELERGGSLFLNNLDGVSGLGIRIRGGRQHVKETSEETGIALVHQYLIAQVAHLPLPPAPDVVGQLLSQFP